MLSNALLVVVVLLAVTGCGGDDSADTTSPVTVDPTVYLRNLSFEPETVTIEVGETVEWVWDDGALEHDVSGDGFSSELKQEGTFEHTFGEPGTYQYVCTIHQGMEGTITVVATGG